MAFYIFKLIEEKLLEVMNKNDKIILVYFYNFMAWQNKWKHMIFKG